MEISELFVDENVYENGQRFDLGEGGWAVVRASQSERAQKVLQRLVKPYRALPLPWPPEIRARVDALWLTQGVLVQVGGLTFNGKPLDADMANEDDRKRLTEILVLPGAKPFRQRLLDLAAIDSNFQAAADEGLEGNFAASPAGSSPGGGKRAKSS